MTRKGKSTPPQREETEKGFPVPMWFIAVLAVATLAIIFGPTLLAGIGESSVADTANSGGSGTSGADSAGIDVVPAATKEELKGYVGELDRPYPTNNLPATIKLNDYGCEMTGLKMQDDKISFYIENHLDSPVTFRKVKISASYGTSIHFWKDVEIEGEGKKYFVTKNLKNCDGISYPVEEIRVEIRP